MGLWEIPSWRVEELETGLVEMELISQRHLSVVDVDEQSCLNCQSRENIKSD